MPGKSRAFDERAREIVAALLSDPLNLPKEFKGWLPKYLEVVEPQLHLENMVGSLNANRIRANSISADKFEAVLTLVSALIAGDPEGARVEMGRGITFDGDGNAIVDDSFTGIRAYDGDGNLVFKLDAGGGTAQFNGRVGFGTQTEDPANGSLLGLNDTIQVKEQPGGSFQAINLEQSSSGKADGTSTLTVSWDTPTTSGNLLGLMVTVWKSGGAPTITAPSGGAGSYGVLKSHTFDGGDGRQAFYSVVGTGDSGTVSITLSSAPTFGVAQLFEWSGLQNVQDGASDADTGNDDAPSSGVSGALSTQSLVIAGLSVISSRTILYPNGSQISNPSAGYTQISSSTDSIVHGGILSSNVYTHEDSASAQTLSASLNPAADWGGLIVTLKAKSAAVDSSAANTARFYTTPVGGASMFHAVDENGRKDALVLGTAGEMWRFAYLPGTLNLASRSANNGGAETLSLTGAAVGDIVVSCKPVDVTDIRAFLIHPEPVVTVANQVQLVVFNTDAGGSRDPASTTFHVVLIKRA